MIGRHVPQDVAHELGAVEADQPVDVVQVRRMLHDGRPIQAGTAVGNVVVQVSSKRRHERKTQVAVLIDQFELGFGALHHLGDLRPGQDVQDVAGDDRHEIGVVAHFGRIVVPQVLEAREIRHLARRQEGIRAQGTRQEGQSVEGDRHALRLVGQGLRHVHDGVRGLRPWRKQGRADQAPHP